MSKTQENVARGVAWLNENLGPDWPDFIDTDELDMSSSSRCVLGQIFSTDLRSGYWRVVSDLEMGVRWSNSHGFDTYGLHAVLTDEWLRVIDEYQLETQNA